MTPEQQGRRVAETDEQQPRAPGPHSDGGEVLQVQRLNLLDHTKRADLRLLQGRQQRRGAMFV